jgi:hypothetical protein
VRVIMRDSLKLLVPALLLAEALAVQWAGHAERVPAAPELSALPRQIGRLDPIGRVLD